MNILAIDIGSYSIKFVEAKLERKNFVYESFKEVILDQVRKQFPEEITLLELQHEVISSFLNHTNYNGKVIFQIPNNLITTRYIDLPINNRKKVLQVIPFQLEENLPFPINNAHYTNTLHKSGSGFHAQICIAKIPQFEAFYNGLQEKNILPSLLTSELTYFQNYIEEEEIIAPVCILDIGHKTTKAYFSFNKEILANHISYIAGSTITEVITQTYQLANDDAKIYKHENCFFLTEQQYGEVTSDQAEFAKLMKKSFMPLVQEIKRWELGFRVAHGVQIEKIMILGGGSRIQNIDNFLSQALSTSVEKLDIFTQTKKNNMMLPQDEKISYSLTQIFLNSQLAKSPIVNFLKGNYSSGAAQTVSLHSNVFVASRVFAICLLLMLVLLAEKVFLINKDATLETSVSRYLSGPQLGLNPKEQRRLKRDYTATIAELTKKNEQVIKEEAEIRAFGGVDATKHLAELSRLFKSNTKVSLVSYISNGQETSAKFSGTGNGVQDVKEMVDYIRSLNQKESSIKYEDGNTHFTLEYKSNP